MKSAVFSMDGEGAPDLNGFSSTFFMTAWEIVGPQVSLAVQEFFVGASLPAGFSSMLIVLIPQVINPAGFADSHPISLCNFISKIISKLLASRLAPILGKIISPQ